MLSDRDWARSFRSDGSEPLSDQFFKPAMTLSREYNRGTGYFSSSLFSVLGDELQGFLEGDGQLRIVTNVQLSPEDYDAIEEGMSEPQIVESRVMRIIEEEFNPPISDGASAMVSLLQMGRLQLKIAHSTRGGIYHEKIGYFKDDGGDVLAWDGSPNDGLMALETNFESIKVFTGWEPVREDYASDVVAQFEALWSDNTPNLRVMDFSQAAAEELIRVKEASDDLVRERRERLLGDHDVEEVQEQADGKWAHQDEAVRLFVEPRSDEFDSAPMPAGHRGILSMATGTGKTRTACKIISRMIEDGDIDDVIVTTYFTDILDQWSEELDERLPQIRQYSHYRRTNQSDEFELSGARHKSMLCSRDAFGKLLSRGGDFSRTLLIVDECHNFRGDGHIREYGALYERIPYRLGLSATPHSPYSQEANEAMEAQIGPSYFDFGLEEAIRGRILCPFDYTPVEFELMEPHETDRLISTRRSYEYKIKNGEATERDMLIALSRIYKLSESKLGIFENMLRADTSILHRAIIFVETKEYGEMVMEVVMRHGGVSRERWHHYFADAEKAHLDRFRRGELDCLITCKKLNEGVSISDLSSIVMFSSEQGANGLTTTQRMGRALRWDSENPDKVAHVIDFVRMDATQGTNDFERRRWLEEMSLVRPTPEE